MATRSSAALCKPASTPFVWAQDGAAEVITAGTRGIRAYSLDGALKWELKGMSSITAPTPFSKHGLLYIMSGFPGDAMRPVYAIRPGAHGNITLRDGETSNEYIAWSNSQLGTYTTTPLVYGGYYYARPRPLHGPRCPDRPADLQQAAARCGRVHLVMWAYNGKIFAMSEEGDTYVIQAGPSSRCSARIPGRNDHGHAGHRAELPHHPDDVEALSRRRAPAGAESRGGHAELIKS
jgi:hypothetical protein